MDNNVKYNVKKRDSMKTIDVIFVSDELVGSTIVSKKEYERLMRQKLKTESDQSRLNDSSSVDLENKSLKRKQGIKNDVDSENNSKRSKYIDDVELALAALENDNVEKVEVTHRPSTLFDECDISAKKICNFENSNHSSKNDKLSNKANNLVKPEEKSSANKQNDKKQINNPGEFCQTPITLRKRVIKDIKAIQKILENSDDDFSSSDSDSSFKMSDDSSSGNKTSENENDDDD